MVAHPGGDGPRAEGLPAPPGRHPGRHADPHVRPQRGLGGTAPRRRPFDGWAAPPYVLRARATTSLTSETLRCTSPAGDPASQPTSSHLDRVGRAPHEAGALADARLPGCRRPGVGGTVEHVALVAGDIAGREDVPVRVHSECITSEVFGSLKCDCRDQLDWAQAEIVRRGAGAVLYLRQEGGASGSATRFARTSSRRRGWTPSTPTAASAFRMTPGRTTLPAICSSTSASGACSS